MFWKTNEFGRGSQKKPTFPSFESSQPSQGVVSPRKPPGGPDGSGPFRVHGLLRNISSPCCDCVRAPAVALGYPSADLGGRNGRLWNTINDNSPPGVDQSCTAAKYVPLFETSSASAKQRDWRF